MSAEAEAIISERTRVVRVLFTVRVCYADGVVHYYRIGGVSNGEEAVQVARSAAELERPGVAIYTAAAMQIDEQPTEEDA